MKKRTRRRAGLERRLLTAATPVFLLSARRKVLFFNAGCEQLTGWTAADAVGAVCEFASDGSADDIRSLTDCLCPPPAVFEGESQQVAVDIVGRDRRPRPRLIHFTPLKDESGALDSILGVIHPLRSRPAPPRAQTAQTLHAELAALRATLRHRFGLNSLIAASPAMRRVLEQTRIAGGNSAPVLLEGEAGTGKEHIARIIHYQGQGKSRAFVPLDCRASAPRELKRTLRRMFEQQSAAQTAAVAGLQPGTLYLQHVEHLPRDLQQLVTGHFAESPAKADDHPAAPLRLLAAASGPLEVGLDEETLHEDFYYLLSPMRIVLPPLRDRRDDLGLLAQSFLERHNRGDDRQMEGFSEGVWTQFQEYHWPGNLDELQRVVTEARQVSTGTLIEVGDLPFGFRTSRDARAVGPPVAPPSAPLEELLERVEREHIEQALKAAGHNKSRAAKLLSITRTRLYRRMEQLEIPDQEEG